MSEAVLLWSSPPNTRPKHSLTHGQPTRRLRLRPHRRLECVCVLGVCAPRHCLCVCVCVCECLYVGVPFFSAPPSDCLSVYVRARARCAWRVHGVQCVCLLSIIHTVCPGPDHTVAPPPPPPPLGP